MFGNVYVLFKQLIYCLGEWMIFLLIIVIINKAGGECDKKRQVLSGFWLISWFLLVLLNEWAHDVRLLLKQLTCLTLQTSLLFSKIWIKFYCFCDVGLFIINFQLSVDNNNNTVTLHINQSLSCLKTILLTLHTVTVVFCLIKTKKACFIFNLN